MKTYFLNTTFCIVIFMYLLGLQHTLIAQIAHDQYAHQKWYQKTIKISALYEANQIEEGLSLALKAYKESSNFYEENHPYYIMGIGAVSYGYLQTGQYENSIVYNLKIKDIVEKNTQDTTLAQFYMKATEDLSTAYQQQNKFSEAEQAYFTLIKHLAKVYGEKHFYSNHTKTGLVRLYHDYKLFDKLIKISEDIIKYTEKNTYHYFVQHHVLALGYGGLQNKQKLDSCVANITKLLANNPKYDEKAANYFGSYAALYADMNLIAEASGMAKKALAIYEKKGEKNTLEYANLCNNISQFNRKISKFGEAIRWQHKAVQIIEQQNENSLRVNAENYLKPIFYGGLALCYADTGNYKQAKYYILKAINLQEQISSPYNASLLLYYNNLATFNSDEGNQAETLRIRKKVLENYQKSPAIDSVAYADYLSQLGVAYIANEQLQTAEQILLTSNRILLKHSKQPESIARSYLYIADFYSAINNMTTALQWFRKAGEQAPYLTDKMMKLNIWQVLFRSLHNGTAAEHTESHRYLDKYLGLGEQILPKQSSNYITFLNVWGHYYYESAQYTKAIEQYEKAFKLSKEIMGENAENQVTFLTIIANSYVRLKKYDQAEKLTTQALKIAENSQGKKSELYRKAAYSLAMLHYEQGNYSKAHPYFTATIDNLLIQYDKYYSFLSEKEKQEFNAYYKNISEDYYTFCLQYATKNPAIIAELLEFRLLTKGLLQTESQAFNQALRKLANTPDSLQAKQFKQLKNKIATYIVSSKEDKFVNKQQNIDSLTAMANALEKKLLAKIVSNKPTYQQIAYALNDIQKKLGANEVAIEMIKINAISPSNKLRGSLYKDSCLYVALLVTPKETAIMPLNTMGKLIESQVITTYQSHIQHEAKNKIKDLKSHDLLWQPLAQKLKTMGNPQTIYFCPDGIYHQINLNTLYNPETKKYLLDEYEAIIPLTKLTDLLTNPTNSQKNSTKTPSAMLFGDPSFGLDSEKYKDVEAQVRGLPTDTLTTQPTWQTVTKGLKSLVHTKYEIQTIDTLLKKQGYEVSSFLGKKAIEKQIKAVQSPTILHIATHGHFIEKNTYLNPMLNSGLLFTGVNTENKHKGSEDGVLTALETATLDLTNTELVVLSACQTALGNIESSEGVYGLQRGFKIAGAKTLILSLWEANSLVTEKFMTIFYEQWLKTGNKRQAFRYAQTQLKEKQVQKINDSEIDSSLPYYWGAFVMIE